MKYEWQDRYLIGWEDIDLQHHYFFNLVVKISEAGGETVDPEYMKDLFSELYAYVRFHFRSEENIMKHAGFPGLEAHHRHHEELVQELHEKERQLWLDYSDEKLEETVAYLMNWFIQHTTGEDRRIAEFLNAQQGIG